jgi:D-alanyl-D-alanine carboxypeptidase
VKKFITAMSIIVIIGTVTMLSIMTVNEMKESVRDYVNKDVVGNQKENEKVPIELAKNAAEDDNTDSYTKIASKNTEKEKNASKKGTVSGKIKIETTEEETVTNTVNEVSVEAINSDSNIDKNQTTDHSGNNIATKETDYQDNTIEDQEETRQVAKENSKNYKEENSSQKSILSTTIGSAAESITDSIENESKDIQTEEDKSKAVWASLEIVNPSIKIQASSALLMNEDGKILYHKNATQKIYPASTTKLMTALVALDYCSLSDEVTIGEEINKIASDASRAYLKVGERLTFKMLLEGMLLPSGNDAAYATAVFTGRKALNNDAADADTALKEFICLMNEKTVEYGLFKTKFKNPDGYDDDGQYTTAYDMGIIASNAIKNDTISSIVDETSARNVFLTGEDVTWYNSNKLIRSGSGMYYQYAIGLKTGTSSKAGRCLVSAAQKDDKLCISVVMNSTSTGRWEDSIELLKYGIKK